MAQLKELEAAVVTANTTLVTTAETVAATCDRVKASKQDLRVALFAFALVTLGAGATAATARVRRGTTASGTLLDEGNAVQGTAGNTILVAVLVDDELSGVVGADYVLTIEQTGATGNGTVVQAGILALAV